LKASETLISIGFLELFKSLLKRGKESIRKTLGEPKEFLLLIPSTARYKSTLRVLKNNYYRYLKRKP
jgi:hypothetical protein